MRGTCRRLGGAGFARHPDTGDCDAGRLAGFHDRGHHLGELGGDSPVEDLGGRRRGERPGGAITTQGLEGDPGPGHLAPAGDGGGDERHLERRGEQLPLAKGGRGEQDGVAAGAGRTELGGGGIEGEINGASKPEACGDALQPLPAEIDAHAGEDCVDGVGKGVAEGVGPDALRRVAAGDGKSVDDDFARAFDGCFGGNDAGF